jgi:E3 ubiquitin-protein ligase SspH2
MQAAFAGAANLPATEAAPEASRASPPRGADGCFGRAWDWVCNALSRVRLATPYDWALATWARSGDATERRGEAVRRINAVPDPRQLLSLDLDDLGLRDLPPLPARLAWLSCANNQLRGVPEFPASMLSLQLSGNPLEAWPDLPPDLVTLAVAECGLTDVGWLPRQLSALDISDNRIAQLPPDFPRSLNTLLAENNLLTHLPVSMARLPSLHRVLLHGNPLEWETLQQIDDWNRLLPQYTFMTEPMTRALLIVDASNLERLRDAEQTDALDPEAAFARFLTRLRQTVNAGRPDFADELAAWEQRVDADPELRAVTQAIALAATASCEDRVTLTYLAMRRAETTHAIDAGRHDHDAGHLVAMLQQAMREEALDRYAMDRIARYRDAEPARRIDEIETILQYRLGMGDLLPQAGAVREGRWTSTHSGVTDADLQEARSMLERLDAGFPRYLSNLPLWHGVLERWNPGAVAAARERRAELADPEVYSERVRAYLRAEQPGLENDADAQVAAGPVVLERLNHEVFWPLTQQFLQARGVSLD